MKFIASILFLFTLFSCKTTQPPSSTNDVILKLVYQTNIDIPEPSGLSFDKQTNTLWCVSDANGKVYQLDTLGVVIKSLTTKAIDLEGIAFDYDNKTLWIIDESTSIIYNISQSGILLNSHKLDFIQNGNSGAEGICFDNLGNICLLKEKNNGFFYKIDKKYDLLLKIGLNFANDYSGIFQDKQDSLFWIVSDQSQKLFLWDSDKNIVVKFFNLHIPKAEGIVYLPEKQIFYIVSDSERKLYKFLMTE